MIIIIIMIIAGSCFQGCSHQRPSRAEPGTILQGSVVGFVRPSVSPSYMTASSAAGRLLVVRNKIC